MTKKEETLRAKAHRVTEEGVILTLSLSPELMRRGSEGEESPPLSNNFFI
jgi:hypothetical protein